MIRPVADADLEALAAIHTRAFPDSAITAFGPAIVESYYRWLLVGPHDAAVMGAWRDQRLVGFCAAGVFHGAMNGFLRANRLRLLRHLVTHPSLVASELVRDRIRSAVKITFKFSRAIQTMRPDDKTPEFGVLSIATDPTVRGSGAGRALMQEAEARARRGNHGRMVLTVHPNNLDAVRFYEGLGWKRATANGNTWTGIMHRPLEPRDG